MKLKLPLLYIFVFFASSIIYAQDARIVPPQEVPSQNLLEFNRYFINPTFSRVGLKNSYLSLYTRNQWVQFDDAPTSYLLNYVSRVNDNIGVGFGIQQQNNGILNYFGINANYSYGIQLSEKSWFTLGTNISYLDSGIKSSAITADSDPLIANYEESTLLTFKPGVNLTVGRFDIGFYSENLFSYDLKTSAQAGTSKIFSGHLMYSQPLADGNLLRAMARGRKNENGDAILSGSLLFDVPRLGWAQAGYDDFYGGSIGLGINLSDHISIGYVLEKGLSGTTNNLGVTHELTLAYKFREVSSDVTMIEDLEDSMEQFARTNAPREIDLDDTKTLKEEVAAQAVSIKALQRRQDSIQQSSASTTENQLKQRIAMKKVEEHMKKNSSNPISVPQPPVKKEAEALNQKMEVVNAQKQVRKSPPATPASVPATKAVFTSVTGTRHPSGFYLVGNIFRNKTYAQRFQDKLKADGFANSSYLKDVKNGLSYVTIDRFNTLEAAEDAYRSKMQGRYSGPISILEIKGENTTETILNPSITTQQTDTQNSTSEDGNSAFAKADKPQVSINQDISNAVEKTSTTPPATATKTQVGTVSDKDNASGKEAINEYGMAQMPDNTYKLIYGSYSDPKSAGSARRELTTTGQKDVQVFMDKESSTYYLLYGTYRTIGDINNATVKPKLKNGVLNVGNLTEIAVNTSQNEDTVKASQTTPAPLAPKRDIRVTMKSESLDGTKAGYYIVANVYEKNYYYTRFIKSLESQNLKPQTFINPKNNYKYVYIERYDTYEEAKENLTSQLEGRYTDSIWIFEIE